MSARAAPDTAAHTDRPDARPPGTDPPGSDPHRGHDGEARRPAGREGLSRITVNLTPRAAQALDQAVKLTGDSKTDTINRALLVYAYFEEVMQNGGTFYTQAAGETELVRLHFF